MTTLRVSYGDTMLAKLRSYRGWGLGFALLALVWIVYFPILNGGFVWDDYFLVQSNVLLRDASGLWKIWFTAEPQDHTPITLSAFWLEYHCWHLNPLGYHVVDLLTHGVSAILLWRAFVRLTIPGAWFVAALFAVHPVCVASAAWVSEQKNTWAMIFYLLTLLCYLSFRGNNSNRENRRWGWYTLALISYLLALWSKGSVVVLPPILLVVIWWQHGRVTAKDVLSVIPFFALAFGEGLLTIWFQNHQAIDQQLVTHPPFLERFAAAGWVFWFYLWKSWMPWKLAAIYPQWRIDPRDLTAYLPNAAACGIFVVAWINREKWGRAVLFGLGTFALSLFPVMGFFRMSFQAYSRVADHLEYLALPCSVALAVTGGNYLLTAARQNLHRLYIVRRGVAVCLLAAFAISTWARATVYKTDESLWRDAIAKNPQAWVAEANLGTILVNRANYQEAHDCFERALKLKPDFKNSLDGMGGALDGLGKHDEATQYYERALSIAPDSVNILNHMGLNLMDRKMYTEARQTFERILQSKPDERNALQNLGALYEEMGDTGRALVYYERLLNADPESGDAADAFGGTLIRHGDLDHGIDVLKRALLHHPKNNSIREHLADALLQKGKVDDAVGYISQNLADDPTDAGSWYTMGNYRFLRGDFQGAVEAFENACKFRPDFVEASNNLNIARERLRGSTQRTGTR